MGILRDRCRPSRAAIRRFLLCGADRVNILRRNSKFREGAPRVSNSDTRALSPQDCLVALMIAVSASDEDLRTAELVKIQSAVNMLPIFSDYDIDRMRQMAQVVFDLFEQEDGLDALFGLIRDNLPERLFETAYALACDVAAADGTLNESELRLLEEIRYELDLDRLHAAAIERGARARHMT
jgi:tellurite resistance protein